MSFRFPHRPASGRPRFARGALGLLAALAGFCLHAAYVQAQPVDAPTISIDELVAGQTGEVWTVFQGNKPEPFSVEVTGVIRNSLGPGKSLILCKLTDPRVQNMGAAAGMSGSPLYIGGKLAGALSYQVQRFETVRYAGFTPIADLLEVQQLDRKPTSLPGMTSPAAPEPALPLAPRAGGNGYDTYQPLSPVFAFGGVAPNVAALFADRFQAVGLSVGTLSGHDATNGNQHGGAKTPLADPAAPAPVLRPGEAVAAALAIGDITIAGTGTVSHVSGNQVLAFGHPMLGFGSVDVPMAAADIVAILPSNLSSFKISNTGRVIGTIRQDRLSAIYGELGPVPEMLPVSVKTPARTLRFQTLRHPRLTPMITAMGLTQAVLGSNEAGLNEGFRVVGTATFADGGKVSTDLLFSGPQAFNAGLDTFIRRLNTWLQNPVTELFPTDISFEVQPLERNPSATLDIAQVSRSRAQAGDTLSVSLTTRDYQSAAVRELLGIQIPADWAGRNLEVVIMTGNELDRLSGRPDSVSASQIRNIEAYLNLLRGERRSDGLYVAVVEKTGALFDQTTASLEVPGSFERIARNADETRFQRRELLVPLWEKHVLPDRLVAASIRRPLAISE